MGPAGGVRAIRGVLGPVALALVLAAVLVVSAKDRILQAVDGPFLNVVDDCEGTEALVREIDALPVFAGPPPGTRPERGYESPGGGTGCLDDSGDELVTGSNVLVLVGEKRAVSDHLRAVAEADGWTPGPVTGGDDDERDPSDLCFQKRLTGGRAVFQVWFEPREKSLTIEVFSLLDGTPNKC